MASGSNTDVADQFLWHHKDIPLREFVEHYASHAPFVIMVTTGYLGRDEGMHGISCDEVGGADLA